MTTPGILLREKAFSHRSRKTSEPMSYPYTAALQPVRERPGLALDLCFGMGQARGFFWCDTTSHPPQGSNPGGLARNSQ
jgi:hypothetical protein